MTGMVALGAALVAGFASAEISGANAQAGDEREIEAEPLTEAGATEFVAGEIVQPIPADIAEDATDAAPSAKSLDALVADTLRRFGRIDAPDTPQRRQAQLVEQQLAPGMSAVACAHNTSSITKESSRPPMAG